MKKLINAVDSVVPDMCSGLVLANPTLSLIAKYKIILRREQGKDKVRLISGGGSGHEPAHAGFVGDGMLDAAVCGNVFASPSQVQVYQAIRAVAGEKGVLLIIKNYSGDLMNFKNAAVMAQEDGIDVAYVCVNDDIAVEDSLYTVGRRGVAGTIFVHKIAGALAERGATLEEVRAVAQKTVDRTRSIGVALSSCTVPTKGTPTFSLLENEIEYGVGIHGEPGRERTALVTADELARRMCGGLLSDLVPEKGEELGLLVNGLGATTLQELYILNNSVRKILDEKGLPVYRSFVGNYMTSIDMQGASVSLIRLDEELKSLLDAPAYTPALTVMGPSPARPYRNPFAAIEEKASASAKELPGGDKIGESLSYANIVYLVRRMGESVIRNEVPFCELDSHAGDGDFGMSVASGFRQLSREWTEILEETDGDIGAFLDACALVIMEHCGGASGPIWGAAFRAAASSCTGKQNLTLPEFAHMMQMAVKGIQATGERSFGRGAVVGDKTLIDALVPCADTISDCAKKGGSFEQAIHSGAEAAAVGAEKTRELVARMGRAGTVGKRSLGYPDAGAYALGVIFRDLAAAMS